MRLATIVILIGLNFPAFGQQVEIEEQDEASEPDATEDPARGQFLALPFIITEPAIGEGLGAGLVYFHRDDGKDRPKLSSASSLARTGRKQTPPPTATGLFGFYTSNDTAGVGIGHSRTFNNDSWRLLGVAARARINAKVYIADAPFNFSLDGTMLFTTVKNRLGNSPWFLGASLSIADAKAEFDISPGDPARGLLSDFKFMDVGVSAIAIYDTRDDTMMPSEGTLIDLTIGRNDEALGGDFSYNTARFKANSFFEFADKFVLGLRFEVSAAGGNVPFYAEPFVPLRGIPALRFQGDVAGVVEAEARYQLASRWAVLVFAGAGFVGDTLAGVESDQNISAWGIGTRFLALPEKNVWVGLDLARGPEEDAYYIQLTHPW